MTKNSLVVLKEEIEREVESLARLDREMAEIREFLNFIDSLTKNI